MDFKYKVSVVVPVYNAEEYLRECVDSILNQKKFDTNELEILLVNDGSKDGSEPICQEYAAAHGNITYIYKENSGVSDTRNLGISRSTGKYILLLDSDDYIGETTLAALVKFFDAHYDEIDLCTYSMYRLKEDVTSLHPRYSEKHYDKGTGVYDLDKYYTLTQSTINVFFKNRFDENVKFESQMRLSEDQYFDTCNIMKKHKIGFVKEAEYFYRVNPVSVSKTINHPYYCFEDIISYNERLLDQFSVNGVPHKYVQNIVMSTLVWRAKSDMLLPHHLEGEEYEKGVQRIRNIIKKLENSTIISYQDADRFFKVFFLQMKGEKLAARKLLNGFAIDTDEKEEVCKVIYVNFYLRRATPKGNQMNLNFYLASPIAAIAPLTVLKIKETHRDGTHTEHEVLLKASHIPYYTSKTRIAEQYPVAFTFDYTKTSRLSFYVPVLGKDMPVYIRTMHHSGLNVEKYLYGKPVGDYFFKCTARCCFTIQKYTALDSAMRVNKVRKQARDLKEVAEVLSYRKHHYTGKEKVWLYVDSKKVIDNAFYQYVHDFEKKDGVDRYYIVHDEEDDFVRSKMTAEQASHIVLFGSKEHKILFLQAEKILVSFLSYSMYYPFNKYECYGDLFHYELIYLQHGILHAHLPFMYGKTFTDISRIVISSEFEKENLIENYDYQPEDLIMTGMPRFSAALVVHPPKNRILFAPSWRQYLIGELVDNERMLRTDAFLKSDWYNRINEFLHSQQLSELLEKYDLYLDFKLHPIFKPYEELFNVSDLKRVDINYEETILDEYKIFITDFSSFQFDYVRLVRPICYFLPDRIEFQAGIHSYRELDLKYEKAFGPLYEEAPGVLQFLEQTLANDCAVEEPYKERMENFFTIAENPCEALYQELIKDEALEHPEK